MFVLYGSVLALSDGVLLIREVGTIQGNSVYLREILKSMLPIYVFYTFYQKGMLTEERLKKWAFVFIAVAIFSFFQTRARDLLQRELLGYAMMESTNNASYFILACLPFAALFYKKTLLQYMIIAVLMVFILFGVKRGAILSGGCAVIYFFYGSLNSNNSKNTKSVLLLTLGIIFLGNYILKNYLLVDDFYSSRLQSITAGEIGERDYIYSDLWNHFIEESSIIEMLFGNGAWSTLRFTQNFAHQDWLEILTNQGLLGIAVYGYFWVKFIAMWRNSKTDDLVRLISGMLIIIYFIKSVFSMSVNDFPIYATCLMGFIFARSNDINNYDISK